MNSRTPTEQRFLDLVTEHQLRLRQICCGFTWKREDQEALYQEMLFQLWRGLLELDEAKATSAWVYRVALNAACSLDRQRGIRNPAPAQPSAQGTGPSDPGARLSAAMDQLSPLERALATLYLENLPPEEMAAVLGLSSSQAGERLQRLKPQLFACLQEPHPNEETLKQRWQQLPVR
ncbi:MAG TPA: RNA polymerase sigma factor, partial [Candidatus Sulfotelmatobacter sp.]|nr:RNA polymerase sigma factor [Candidatus Sulfotelmatobacter sp.]